MSQAIQAADPQYSLRGEPGRRSLPFGFLAFLGAGTSLVFCYAQVLISLLAPLFGLAAFEMNIHAQAIFMWGFALVTLVGLVRDRKRHSSNLPLMLSAGAVVTIAGTLYTFYDVRILILGYVPSMPLSSIRTGSSSA